MKTAGELWELWEQARLMPYGSAQIALIDQLLRHVDGAGDPELAFNARLLATNAYGYGGEPAKAFVTFSWTVSDFDRNPAPHHANRVHTLLWQFKSIVNALTAFPEIPLERTHAVLDDMERRYREGGHGLQAVHKHRYLVADHVGDTAGADEWYRLWQATPRDDLSDCAGCDPSSTASYLSSRHRYAEVVALAEPVLAGRLSCTEQPQGILRELMVPYLRTGEPQKAADAHRRAYRLERGNLADLWNIGTHIGFCARTGNEHRGLEILQRHIDWLTRAPSPASEMNFAADAALLLRRLTELGHGDLPVRRRDRDDIAAAELATELAGRARELAARFDARNGTRHQSNLIEEKITAEPYGVDIVLSPTARAAAPIPAPPPPPEPAPVIPSGLGAAELLDLAREHAREEREAAVAATLDELDARFGELDDPLLAGRRLVLRGDLRRDEGDVEGMLALWRQALELFTAAGAREQIVVLRSRMALDATEPGGAAEPGGSDGGEPGEGGDPGESGRSGHGGGPDEEPVRQEVAYQDEHGGPLERAAAWSRLADAHFRHGRHDESAEAAAVAGRLAEQSGRPRLVAMTALLRSRALAESHRHEEAQAAAREAWAFFREAGPAIRRGQVAMIVGQILDDPAEQVALFGEALASGGPGPQLAARVSRARALLRLERPAEAVADLVEAVALCAEQDLPDAAAFSRHELAGAYHAAGRPVEAAEAAEDALLRFERLGFGEAANDCRFLLAGLYRELGDVDGALAGYRDLIERLGDNPAGRGQIGEQLAGLLYDVDRDAEAAAAFEAAAADLRAGGDLIGELRVLRRRVGALHYADQPEAGEETARLVGERFAALPAELAAVPNAVWQHAMTAFEVGLLRVSRGRPADAVPGLRAAVGRLRELGAAREVDRLEGLLGEALLRSGSPAEAAALLGALLGRLPEGAPGRDAVAETYAEAMRAKS